MKRFGQIIELKAEGIAEYVVLHVHPWEAVNAKLREADINNCPIFLKADMALIAADVVTQRSCDLVKPLMLPYEDR